MIRHLFKLIWNKKGAHSLLIIEIWASFMVLFGVLSLIIYNFTNYLQPIGFSYDRVWVVDLSNNQDTVGVAAKNQRIFDMISAYTEVESASRMSNNTPFSANQMNNNVTYNKISAVPDMYETDDNLYETLDLKLLAGRWYRKEDQVSKFRPVVLNKVLAEKFFQDENPLGKILSKEDKKPFKVVGIVDTFKAKGEFMSNAPAIFVQNESMSDWVQPILIRTRPGTDATFEARLVKDIAALAPGWGIEVSYMTESRQNRHKLTLIPVIIFLIISGFLLTNVALGLFGILNLNISRRRSEIGLRRAMGATGWNVTLQILGEMWTLSLFSILIGLLFAVQFPLLHVFDLAAGVYLWAMVAALLTIFVIVTLCAWYPGQQAARIHPATALHEE
ncbi:ABC transporter permease [Arundinibacter roseus]|uniref:FtsX-like permease family protein n=1 Tax=Arundinibacter roseus TaxID=2070510 RepID=A0A4V6P8Q3_9BACT|nr:FtsX-like permease family protein [Arundinibacter roseus]TDB67305.1 FtsX-like permease family protein [Arundinibacter roseus]